jgi:hypothetical protein
MGYLAAAGIGAVGVVIGWIMGYSEGYKDARDRRRAGRH